MDFIVYYIMPFSIFSILYGIAEHNRDKYKIKRLSKYREYFNKEYTIATLIWINMAFMFYFSKIKHFNVSNNPHPIYAVLISCLILGISLTIIRFNILSFIKNNEKIISYTFGVIALTIAILTLTYVDTLITEKTNLPSSFFPNAEKILTVTFAPLFWLGVVILILFLFYFALAALTCFKTMLQIKYIAQCYKSITIITNLKYIPKPLNGYIDQAAFASLFVILRFVPQVIYSDLYSNHINSHVVDVVLLSSFDHYKNSCIEKYKTSDYIHYLDSEKIILAKKDSDNSYGFYVANCTRTSTNSQKKS
ncbi:hypothetical protein [uncultured Tolumonas sp.]|uniref:hypothetical protein n=1 Tax=uncultured Tolumonas sp. TaxID=263765 RepID=UPI00292CC5E7|nr:hypothetical protein [uncultured Tolumonas sp.]